MLSQAERRQAAAHCLMERLHTVLLAQVCRARSARLLAKLAICIPLPQPPGALILHLRHICSSDTSHLLLLLHQCCWQSAAVEMQRQG